MELTKIVRIENIGRFRKLTPKGDVALRRVNLLFGPNGQGKTTIAGILRSLKAGDPAYVDERRTLGVKAKPVVELRLSSGGATFSDGKWTATASDLEIFDSTFVNDNVYTGDHVNTHHRKNLYEVIVGEAAVAVARQIDRLDSDARAATREISEHEAELRQHIQAPFAIDDFLELRPETDLEPRILSATTRLTAVRKSQEIVSRRELDPLMVPNVPQRIMDVLGTSAADISARALQRVQEHIRLRLDRHGEQWLRLGLEYVRDDRCCPFCAQDTSASEIVGLYREYFSKTYREFVVDIERAINALEQTLGEAPLHALEKQALENESRIRLWRDLADLTYATAAVEPLGVAWRRVATLIRERLQYKQANPSEPTGDDPEMKAALRDFSEAASVIEGINARVIEANQHIARLKSESASTSAETLESELRRLRNTQIRQVADVDRLCNTLKAKRDRKKRLEQDKKAKRQELESMASGVLSQYEEAINSLLKVFGANFTLTNTRPSFSGGKASSTYQIAINKTPLNLGDSKTPRGTPCFRTALSSGDKSTLALAFFLARLERDTQLKDKVVILDDPLSSLDCFRATCTQQHICRLSNAAAQVIVLSHDAFFLKQVYDACAKATLRCLHVVRDKDEHHLCEWDVEHFLLAQSHRDYFVLRTFLAHAPMDVDALAVARAIRPYLEGHLRHTFPGEFAPNEWLKDFADKVESAQPGAPLAALKSTLQELRDINDYCKRFHHTNGGAPVPPNETELHAYVERALNWVQGG